MTLTIEVAPEVQQALEEEAQRQGMEPKDFAAKVLISHLASTGALHQRSGRVNRYEKSEGATFLALLDEVAPIIEAGKLRPITSEDITRTIHEAREEHDLELAASMRTETARS